LCSAWFVCHIRGYVLKYLSVLFYCNFCLFQIKVTVLYVDPTSKALVLSELTHLTNPNRTKVDLFGNLAVGDVINEAVVLWANAKHGVFLRLPDKQKAFASVCKCYFYSQYCLMFCVQVKFSFLFIKFKTYSSMML